MNYNNSSIMRDQQARTHRRITLGSFLTALVLIAVYVVGNLRVAAQYENQLGGYWTLSVRASSLPLKLQYLNQFVAAVDSAHLSGHNAVLFPTVQNDVGQNIGTLKSLQQRLNEIQTMDVMSFQYQQAIAQITAQEQGEAEAMLSDIAGTWCLEYHPWLWAWYQGIAWFVIFGLLGFSFMRAVEY